MPTDVVQSILGHAFLQTTSITKAERRRKLEAAAQYYADDDGWDENER